MRKILVAIMLSIAVVPALADTTADVASENGFYIGIDAGSGKTSLKDCVGGCVSSGRDNGAVVGILLGHQYNKNLAVEFKYSSTGKFESNTAPIGNIIGDALALAAVGIVPVSNEFNLYGKLGVASTKTRVSDPLTWNLQDKHHFAATVGVGAQYNLTPITGIRLGYDYYEGKLEGLAGASDIKLNYDVWTIGLVFKIKELMI